MCTKELQCKDILPRLSPEVMPVAGMRSERPARPAANITDCSGDQLVDVAGRTLQLR